MNPPYDKQIAYAAAAIDQCMKMGAVVLQAPKAKATGFAPTALPPFEPKWPEVDPRKR